MDCCIMKGVTEQCTARLCLTEADHLSLPDSSVMKSNVTMDPQTRSKQASTRDLEKKLTRIDLNKGESVIVTKEMLEKLLTPKGSYSGYKSDETVIYFPVVADLPKKLKEVLLNKGVKSQQLKIF